jgi:FeS assembly SUF system regulator
MFRISRLTDYATMILVHLAAHPGRVCSASDVAAGTRVALPTVQKLLKVLTRGDLVQSVRGAEGGYSLALAPAAITAARILDVMEGPLGITECSSSDSHCELEDGCRVGGAWQKINRAIHGALSDVTLADLINPPREFPVVDFTTNLRHRPHRGSRPDPR